ncbi:hypothetical protein MTR67_026908 [Solanum verrucosum]|nr:hypothetical protein MTR67_026908 [Solanum verrucosum]
MSVDRCP